MNQEIFRKTNQRGFASPLLLILLLVLVAVLSSVGTYLFLENKRTLPSTVTPTPSPTPTSNVTVDQTADWKTYTNREQGVEFKYPSNWYSLELPDSTFVVFLSETPMQYLGGSDAPLGPIYVGLNECKNTITNEKYPCTKSSDESVSSLNSILSPDSLRIKDVRVAGKTAKQVSGTIAPNQPKEGIYIEQTFIPFNDYQIVATLERKNLEKIYDQILPTFKFTN